MKIEKKEEIDIEKIFLKGTEPNAKGILQGIIPTLDKDEKGPIINVGTIKDILLIEIKRTLNEFWREYATLNNEISPEKKLVILNEHIKNLTLWLNLDRK